MDNGISLAKKKIDKNAKPRERRSYPITLCVQISAAIVASPRMMEQACEIDARPPAIAGRRPRECSNSADAVTLRASWA
jgi:hypothetical protein